MAASSNIHSNALNFLSFVENGVDPRTGLYTCNLTLPKLIGNDLAGPELPLRLVYSPLNTLDSGFGKGWSLQLSQYDTASLMVALSTGENFKVTGSSSDHNQLSMREKKIDTFHLHKIDEEHFQVVHKSGLVEDLQVVGADTLAVPVKMSAASGHHLTLEYRIENRLAVLQSVKNADGSLLLTTTRLPSRVELLLHPGQGDAESLFSLILEGSEARVARIELPTDNLASWRFGYQEIQGLLCINKVEGPLGGSEQITYDSKHHQFPGLSDRYLPRVARHLNDPGKGQAPVDTRYEYDDNDHNFLGHGAQGLVWDGTTGEDNLFRVLTDYTYRTWEKLWDKDSDSPLRTIERTFNRFHLAVSEITRQGDCVQGKHSEYHILDGKHFADQPPQCQLPSKVTNTWHYQSSSGHRREDVELTAFDAFGNEIKRVEADGTSETSEYYPAGASDGCPADPQGFVRNLKNRLTEPADSANVGALALRSEFRYALQDPVNGASGQWLAQVEEKLLQDADNVELQKIVTHYFNQPNDPLHHGRTAGTETRLGGKATFTDYFYSKPVGRRADQNVLRIAEVLSTSFDKSAKTITRESSLINGEPLLDLDDNDVEIAYVYDRLGRVIEETVAPGTDYAATRSFEYVLVAKTGNSASQIVTDVKGVKIRSHFDALQRVLEEERQDPGKTFRPIYSARYDALGQLVESSETDWHDTEEHTYVTLYTYDDWAEEASVTGPDGVTSHSLNDPVKREVRTWRDGEGRTLTRKNAFDKPELVERFDLACKSYSKHEYFYDGLGRLHHEYDPMNLPQFYQYDAFDRVTLRVLADRTRIERRYASHSRKELSVWIGADGKVLGEQGFDGLGRRTSLQVGSYHEEFIYAGGHMHPATRITPAGESIDYEYTVQLTSAPVGLVARDEEASFTFDHADAQLRASENNQGRREFDYDAASHLSEERWKANDQTWTATWGHSRLGRQLCHTDANGVQSVSEHDEAGRLEHVTQGRVSVDYCYDSLSRPYITTCKDLDAGTELVTTLTYDDWGREISRTLALTGQPLRTLTQGYRQDDRVVSRHLQSGEQTLLEETFGYDERGRLTSHACSGSQLPQDSFGNAITEQTFTFDGLDNLIEVYTRFADDQEDTCTRTFSSSDPCQLVNVQHSRDDYPSLALEYDDNGNLRFDEHGRELVYDIQSRLSAVKDADGQVLSSYRYDAHDQLCSEAHTDSAQTLRFYQGERLDCSVQQGTGTSYLHDDKGPLAQQQAGSSDGTLLLLTGANLSVIGEGHRQTLREASYSAWGARDEEALDCHLGFNGEVRERHTGWYLLGKGYRAYNPYLMCFHSPDSMSPFEDGGINRYMYCAGDPVNFRDPTGHAPKWLGVAMLGLGIGLSIMTLGAGIASIAAAKTLALGFSALSATTKLSMVTAAAGLGLGATELFVPDITTRGAFRIATLATGVASVSLALKSILQYRHIYGKLAPKLKEFKEVKRQAAVLGRPKPNPSILGDPGALDDLARAANNPASKSSSFSAMGDLDVDDMNVQSFIPRARPPEPSYLKYFEPPAPTPMNAPTSMSAGSSGSSSVPQGKGARIRAFLRGLWK
ncbi:RHS repeat domain-containing protein [Pseudomonas wadenswilerensis]